MRLHETVLRMREVLLEQDVELTPRAAREDETYKGDGQAAQRAWEAFKVVAAEPAYDPVHAWGESQVVRNAGFLFEGTYSPKEHYELSFTRQFNVGEYGDMMGLFLTIFVPGADELRDLQATIWGGDDDGPGISEWFAEVEADPAFQIPMRHRARRFTFVIDAIG
jgi:hypothetical protein